MNYFDVDGNLIEQFRAGNRSAIKVVSSLLSRKIRRNCSYALTSLAEALDRIGKMEGPNAAFAKAISSRLSRHLERDPSDVITALAEVLERIGNGEDPNSAFGWTQHGKNGRRCDVNNALRDFEVRTEVQSLMREGLSLTAACAAVSVEKNGIFLLSNKTVEAICNGLRKDTDLSAIPDDVFPLTPNKYTNRT